MCFFSLLIHGMGYLVKNFLLAKAACFRELVLDCKICEDTSWNKWGLWVPAIVYKMQCGTV